MIHTLAPWLSALVSASLKGSVILIAVVLAARAMRRSSAEARHAILAIGLVAFLIVPVASVLAPAWAVIPLPALPAEMVSAIDRAAGDDRVIGQSDASFTGGESAAGARDVGTTEADGPGATARDVATRTLPAENGPRGVGPASEANAPRTGDFASVMARLDSPSSTVRSPSLAEALMLAWLIGASIIGLRLLLGLARLRFLSKRATMVTDGAWLHAAHAIARRLGLTRGITLLRGDREAVPMTWGVLSPVVWLPPAADRWPAELRMSVLSHELAHVRRRDAVMQWIANVAVALHWFNPLVWLATRAMRAERERACDDAVLALGAAPDDYAAHLLDMVRALGTRGGPAPAMAMARRSQFEGRLLAILDRASSRGPVGSGRLVLAGGLAAALVLALGGLRTGEAARVTTDPGVESQPPVASPAPVAPAGIDRTNVTQPVEEAKSQRSITAPVAPSAPAGAVKKAASVAAAPPPPPSDDREEADFPSILSASLSSATTPAPRAPPAVAPPSFPPRAPATSVPQGATFSPSDTALLLEVIAAAEGITSSSDRVAVLERVANLPDLAPAVVTALGRAAGRVTSSTSRTKLLRTLVRKQPHSIGESRRAVLEALSHEVNSNDFSAVLEEFVKRDSITEPALADAFTTAAKITSSSEKARLLVAAARHRTPEGTARAAYLKTAATISTGSDRARALSALFEDPPREREGSATQR